MTRKRPDEEQRMREEREAERRDRERSRPLRARRDRAGRDALRIKLAERGAAVEDDPATPTPAATEAPGPFVPIDLGPGPLGPLAPGIEWSDSDRLALIAISQGPEPLPAAVDLDMRPSDVGAANRWHAYMSGWRVGARGGVPDPKATGHADRGIADAYHAGYDAGGTAVSAAARRASERYGYEPSVLRAAAAETPERVITEAEVAAALTTGAREREQAEQTTRHRPRGGRR